MNEQRIYGLWDSPITPHHLAASLRITELGWDTDGQTLGWVEGRSGQGVLVVQREGEAATRDLTETSIRALVGYGGGDFTLSHGAAYYVAQADQRIYRQPLAGGPARPITPAFGAASSPAVSPDGRWLAYVHSYEDTDVIALVDTEGAHWPTRIATGRDFYMQPAWSPSGDRLAWIEWDHPHMPWDETTLRLAALHVPASGLPAVASTEAVAGGAEVAVFQPLFTPDGRSLLYISDESGWGHVYRRDLASGAVTQLTSSPGEYGRPAWPQGLRNLAVTASGTVVTVRSENGFDTLVAISPSGQQRDLGEAHSGYTNLAYPVASPAGEQVALIASATNQPPRVVVIDLAAATPAPAVRRRTDSETVPLTAMSQARPVSYTSFDGEEAHGLYLPPASDRFTGSGAPPLVLLAHGGPTSQTPAAWSPQAQFFATRGYAVFIPNYRGSTGYGREYMRKLRHSWGIYDVRDARAGTEHLVAQGLADASRLVIMGGSAGGFTVLQSLVEMPGFYKAAICMYGVSNMFTLAADTHKFEAHYLDSMLGPLPEASSLYRERSPLFHAARITDPVAVFQGDIDRVVPREQSDSIVASLRARGVPHEYHVYEGEGHGWRKAETIERFYSSVEAFLRQHVLYA